MLKLRSCFKLALLAFASILATSFLQADEPASVKFQNENNSETHETLIQDHLATLKELSGVLTKVKDEKTATDNQAELEKVAGKMKSVKERADKLGKPTPEQEQALKTKYEADVKKATTELLNNIFRISKDEAAMKVVQGALQKAE